MAISGGQQRLDWYAVPGVPLTLVLDTADGTAWASAPIVHVGPIDADGDITPVIPAQTATITGTASRATLTLTDAQMAAILTAYPVAARTACPWHVRLGTGESELAVSTGHIIWDTTGRMVTASAQLVVGPAGLTAVSADAGNAASLGTDGLIYVAPGAGTVSSVNGQTGAVVLGAADVGADPAGMMAAHLAAVDPHPQYVPDSDARLSDARTPLAHTHTATGISDSTTVGRAVLTAADAAAARTAIGAGTLSTETLPATLVDAKGDLIVGTGNDTPARLAVGSDGHVLTADAASAGGVKWAASGGGSDPWTYVIATADTTNDTATEVNVAGLSIPSGLASGLYVVEALVLTTSANYTVAPVVGIAWTADVTLYPRIDFNTSTTFGVTSPVVGAATQQPVGSNAVLPNFAIFATMRLAATMTGSVNVILRAEVAGTQVTVKADSWIRYRRIGD